MVSFYVEKSLQISSGDACHITSQPMTYFWDWIGALLPTHSYLLKNGFKTTAVLQRSTDNGPTALASGAFNWRHLMTFPTNTTSITWLWMCNRHLSHCVLFVLWHCITAPCFSGKSWKFKVPFILWQTGMGGVRMRVKCSVHFHSS